MSRLTLLAALALAAPAAVHARAGGGGSYSSGSSHSSYSSGSSYSGGSSYSSGGSYRSSSSGSYGGSAPMSPFEAKFFNGLLVVLVVVWLLMRWFESNPGGGGRAPAAAAGFAALKSADPSFDEGAFLARAETAFRRVQEAWSAGDMTPAAALLSDGVYERFQLLLELQRREGRLNKLDDLRVRAIVAADAAPGRSFDAVDVRIEASCKDRYVSVQDGSVLSEEDGAFVEFWSFARSVSARGRVSPGALEGFCPGCGAGLTVNASAVCPQCQCWVNSGEFDWVLAEITQESEWRGTPADSAQELEDRASMLFWRWQRCLADKDPAALEGWCSEEGLEALRVSGVGRLSFFDCGVGAVELQPRRVADGFEYASVFVRWAGREGAPDAPSRKRRTTLTLARHAGVNPKPNTALRSAHCAGCGAAIPPAAPACAHCGLGFKDPAAGWVLVDLETFDS